MNGNPFQMRSSALCDVVRSTCLCPYDDYLLLGWYLVILSPVTAVLVCCMCNILLFFFFFSSSSIWCYCNVIHISYKNHVTNEEVRAKIQQAIGPHADLSIVNRRRLQWYGHVSRSSDKTVLQGTVKGGRRQGRQRKRWEDNISE